jgi:hypothetical protein
MHNDSDAIVLHASWTDQMIPYNKSIRNRVALKGGATNARISIKAPSCRGDGQLPAGVGEVEHAGGRKQAIPRRELLPPAS